MFVIHFQVTFKIGDTIDCDINSDTIDCDINSVPATVTYKDKGTLVIEPSEVGLRENERAVESCRNSNNFTEAPLARVQKP
jgi:hypothetical protein